MGLMSYFSMFFPSQLFVKIPYPTSDLSGHTIIVTGANTGLGLEAARHLVRLNAARVILAVRTISKGEAAAADISSSLSTSRTCIEIWQVDLSNYDSIMAFAERVKTLDRLDAVVQNAGTLITNCSLTEGQESTITVNVIGTVLLGLSVLPKLQESAAKYLLQGRMTFVGSDLIYVARFKEKDASGKLFDALKVKEGVDMDDRSVQGACKSDIFRDDIGWFQELMMSFALGTIVRTTEVGSRVLVHAVQPGVGERTHGAFMMDCKVRSPGPNVDSGMGRKMQERTTEELFAILEQISPGVIDI